jgi:hypothetical protein
VKIVQKILIFIVLIIVTCGQSMHAQDTASVARPVKHKFKPETMKATMFAVAFPGLGQVYNRKIWKIPVVYGGFGALFYSAGFNAKYYNTYTRAYQDLIDGVPSTRSYEKLILASPDTYDPVKHPSDYLAYKEAMLRMVDYYKRYRDLSYIGIAGWYLLSILDANVDASLFNYDVSPDLNITLAPIRVPTPGGFMGAGISVDLKINF